MKIIFAVLIAIALLAPAQSQEDGLVGEWHFDDGAGNVVKDTSGNGNDGTIYGATWVDGKFGKALNFHRIDDGLGVPDSKSLDIVSTITIAFWMKVNTNPVTGYQWTPLVVKGDNLYVKKYNYGVYYGYGNDQSILIGFGDGTNFKSLRTPVNSISLNNWHYVVASISPQNSYVYINGVNQALSDNQGGIATSMAPNNIPLYIGNMKISSTPSDYIIDDVRIYNRALSADEIKSHYEGKQTSLTLTKTASPYSIKQGQTTTITLTIKNTGTTDITNIEVMDSIHRNFDLIGGDFPNPRKFDIIGKDDSREIQYMIKSKEAGTFNLDPATGIYADKDGNIQETKSEPFSVKVITYFEPNPIKTSAPASTPEPTTNPVKTASVSLYGEKTDVVLGEDILLKLSAVNLITKPMMHVQVIIIPPSGMSVTSSEFSKIAAGQFTANYELPPGDGKDIEVSIKSNQIGDFNVNGRIIYYFGDEKGTAEDHNLNLPIKVRKEAGQTVANPTPIPTTPGFAGEVAIIGVLYVALFIRRRKI